MTDMTGRPRSGRDRRRTDGPCRRLRACQAGHRVTVLERDNRIGGMSAQIDFDGTRIERYYHFVCAPDKTTFKYLKEFRLEERLRWTDTHMGFYYKGTCMTGATPSACCASRD